MTNSTKRKSSSSVKKKKKNAKKAKGSPKQPPSKKIKLGETKKKSVVENSRVVYDFYENCWGFLEDNGYDDVYTYFKIESKKHPYLIGSKCPKYCAHEDWEGWTLLECILHGAVECILCYAVERAKVRNVLYKFVCDGAIATDRCYELAMQHFAMPADVLLVLALSGHMPRKRRHCWGGEFLLDAAFERIDDEPEERMNEITRVLLGRVEARDHLGCGYIPEHLAANFEKLPKLKAGVTHKAGGKFADYLVNWHMS